MEIIRVSVAGCLGYDVLEQVKIEQTKSLIVSVAGCLGYDVLVEQTSSSDTTSPQFQLLVV
ncbi:hypothetical protein CRYPA_1196 [uncultured Candidatus Thioglobus sp.]|nr:hypothetical protein CRYPA_1196 [uncultured Candidatus Thioglobus sp.]